MTYERVLPVDFDGTFRFTNDSDEDFIGKWDSKQYHFPAHTTSPINIIDRSPLEIQQIRKKFALDWAIREFGKSGSYEAYIKQERNNDGSPRLNSIHQAGSYSLDQLTPFIQRCLKPLETGKVTVTPAERINTEDKLSRDDEGDLNTIAVPQKGDLIEERKNLRKKALG